MGIDGFGLGGHAIETVIERRIRIAGIVFGEIIAMDFITPHPILRTPHLSLNLTTAPLPTRSARRPPPSTGEGERRE
jgi:hypothetical protein